MNPVAPKDRFPFSMLVAVVGVAVGAALFSRPSHEKLLQRMIADDKHDRAKEVLKTLPPDRRAKHPSFYSIVDLWLSRGVVDRDNPGETAALARQILAKWKEKPDALLERELALVVPLARDPALADAAFDAVLPSLDARRRDSFLRTIKATALSIKQPGIAARAIEQSMKYRAPSRADIMEAAQLWKWAEAPHRALALLDAQAGPPTPPKHGDEEIGWLRVELWRAANMNGEAFDYLRAWRASADGKPHERKIVGLLVEAGLAAERQEETSEEFQSWAALHPDDPETLSKLADIAVAAQHLDEAIAALRQALTLEHGNIAARKKLANYLEWDNRPREAFAEYAMLVEHGDITVIPRMIALNAGLYEDAHLLAVLEKAFADHPSQSELIRELAVALVKSGRYRDAITRLDQHLSHNPIDQFAWLQKAQVAEELELYDEARAAYETAQKIKWAAPVELTLAQIDYLHGDFESSFRRYKKLAATQKDPVFFRAYVGVAEAFGQLSEWVAARESYMATGAEQLFEDYARLAYGQAQLGNRRRQIEVLRAGLARYPEQTQMRIDLVVALSSDGDYRGALAELDREKLRASHPTLVRMRLDLLLGAGLVDEAVSFIRTPSLKNLFREPDLALKAAHVCLSAKLFPEAIARLTPLYAANPEDPETALLYAGALMKTGRQRQAVNAVSRVPAFSTYEHLRALAEIYSEAGQPRHAERVQRDALAMRGGDAYAWGFLGDLRLSNGNKPGARQAYRTALDKMYEPPAEATQN